MSYYHEYTVTVNDSVVLADHHESRGSIECVDSFYMDSEYLIEKYGDEYAIESWTFIRNKISDEAGTSQIDTYYGTNDTGDTVAIVIDYNL